MLFVAILTPLLPLSHFVTHPGTPQKYVTLLGPTPPIFSRSSRKARTKAPCTNSLSIVRGGFCPGFCKGVFCLEGFVRVGFCPFSLLSEYTCCNRKLDITLNFWFHMYDKKICKCDITCSCKRCCQQRCNHTHRH